MKFKGNILQKSLPPRRGGEVRMRLWWGAVLGLSMGSAGLAWADLIPPEPVKDLKDVAPNGTAPSAVNPNGIAPKLDGTGTAETVPGQGPGANLGAPGDSIGAPQAIVTAPPTPPNPPTDVSISVPENDDGLNLTISWKAPAIPPFDVQKPVLPVIGYRVFRGTSPTGPFEPVSPDLGFEAYSFTDTVTSDVVNKPPQDLYYYRVVARYEGVSLQELVTGPSASPVLEGRPQGAWFHTGKTSLLVLLAVFTGLMFYFTSAMRKGKQFFIRRIPGIDAIEEAIGRSTEMGKPILYVPGIDELQDIQTIASMLILGRVAEIVANYESDMLVPCTYPMVREVADEVVRAGYYMAGRPDAYDPKNVRFISSEQFAFCAGTNGIILRQKPAANLFLGRFFAESLIFAETGFINKSIQIAGTAEPTQLPFFVVSCDYTVLGEELFAVSAYLSKDPRLVSSLRASDMIKAVAILSVIVGTILASMGHTWIVDIWKPGAN